MADLVQFELMRPAQIVERRRRCPVVYLPIGPLEWHGPHLPMGTDGIHAHRVAVEVARRVGGGSCLRIFSDPIPCAPSMARRAYGP